MQNKQPLFVVYYEKDKIVSVKKFCANDRKIHYKAEDIRVPIFIACTQGKEDYCGLRSPDGDYLYYIKKFMDEEKKKELNKEEFNWITNSFFNMDTRLTKEPQTKSEDDVRKTNLESSVRETKDLGKDFKRTSQKMNF